MSGARSPFRWVVMAQFPSSRYGTPLPSGYSTPGGHNISRWEIQQQKMINLIFKDWYIQENIRAAKADANTPTSQTTKVSEQSFTYDILIPQEALLQELCITVQCGFWCLWMLRMEITL